MGLWLPLSSGVPHSSRWRHQEARVMDRDTQDSRIGRWTCQDHLKRSFASKNGPRKATGLEPRGGGLGSLAPGLCFIMGFH